MLGLPLNMRCFEYSSGATVDPSASYRTLKDGSRKSPVPQSENSSSLELFPTTSGSSSSQLVADAPWFSSNVGSDTSIAACDSTAAKLSLRDPMPRSTTAADESQVSAKDGTAVALRECRTVLAGGGLIGTSVTPADGGLPAGW
jgi:hypothetical protein